MKKCMLWFIKLFGCIVGCGILFILLFSVVSYRLDPIPVELPVSIPLVLDFTTELSVDQTVKLIFEKYSVSTNAVTVEVIKNEPMICKRIPLAHMIKVKNIVIPGLSTKELRCFFVRNRLMEVQFRPALTDEDCRHLSLDVEMFESQMKINGKREPAYFHGSCAGEDRLLLIDYACGSSIRSELLWKAFYKLRNSEYYF